MARKLKIPDDDTLAREYNVKFYGSRPPDRAIRDFCREFDERAEKYGHRHFGNGFNPWWIDNKHKYVKPYLSQDELDRLVNGVEDWRDKKPTKKRAKK